MPLEVLGKIMEQAKDDGFKTLSLEYRRMQYDPETGGAKL